MSGRAVNEIPLETEEWTVATILKTLSDKGFVKVEVISRFHRYYPAVSKEEYSSRTLFNVASGYFGGFIFLWCGFSALGLP
jgi:predicted transcriptional regulator